MPNPPETSSSDSAIPNRRAAVFLDRDGVLNHDKGFINRPEEFQWISGAKDAVKYLNDLEYLVIVVTNQSGVARGYFSEEDVQHLHRWIGRELRAHDAHIDAFYYCPHHPEAKNAAYRMECPCRKPAPGMIQQAMREWPVEPSKSFLIGDQERDIQAAEAAGVRGFKFGGGNLVEMVRCIVETESR